MGANWLEVIFWILAGAVFYTYIGYGILIFLLAKMKRFFVESTDPQTAEFTPDVTFLVAAWNEKDWIVRKIENGLAFDYPASKLHFFFVTDGSDDGTPERIKNYAFPPDAQFQLFHVPERNGKIAAVERVMPFVKSPFVIFSDANTMVNADAVRNMVRHYQSPDVGAVAGEKRVAMGEKDSAAASEGIYWKYESFLKKMDSEFNTVVGAAGELFSIRTSLFEAVPADTIVEDFYLTMRIAQKGYKVVYEPGAFAVEGKSASVKEELKRKIRIAAGGFQAMVRLWPLLNILKYGALTFQYFSHRILRWTVAPLALPFLYILNCILALSGSDLYLFTLVCQTTFYCLAAVGFLLEKREIKFKPFFIPFYFCMMNYAIFKGFFRFVKGKQSVLWERAQRA